MPVNLDDPQNQQIGSDFEDMDLSLLDFDPNIFDTPSPTLEVTTQTYDLAALVKANNQFAVLEAIDSLGGSNFILMAEDNLSLVYWYAVKKQYWMVQQLINRGADLEYRAATGKYAEQSVLQYAIKTNDVQLIAMLLEANAQTNIIIDGVETNILENFEKDKHKIRDYDRAFGIRSNDHGIAGSRLEGMTTDTNCEYLLDLHKRLPIDTHEYQVLSNLKDNLELIKINRSNIDTVLLSYYDAIQLMFKRYDSNKPNVDLCDYFLSLLNLIPPNKNSYKALNDSKVKIENIKSASDDTAKALVGIANKVLDAITEDLHQAHTQLIVNKLTSADPINASVAFQSGWLGCGGVAGHSIICEIRFIAGDMHLIVHNSGAGISMHGKIVVDAESDFSIAKYASAKIYKFQGIPNEADLFSIVKHIIFPRYKNILSQSRGLTPTELFYKRLEYISNFFGAIEQNPNNYNIAIIYGQRSGTCAWKSLLMFIRNSLSTYDSYLLVKYTIKLDTLNQYYRAQLVLQRDHIPFVSQQLRFAIENLSRMMLKMQSRLAPASLPDFTVGRNLILEISARLDTHIKPTISIADLTVNSDIPILLPVIGYTAKPIVQDKDSHLEQPKMFSKYTLDIASAGSKSPKEELNYLVEVLQDDAISLRYRLAYVEQYIFRLSAEEKLYNEKTKKDYANLADNIDNIFKLSALYTKLVFSNDVKALRLESIRFILILACYTYRLSNSLIGSMIKEPKEENTDESSKGKKSNKKAKIVQQIPPPSPPPFSLPSIGEEDDLPTFEVMAVKVTDNLPKDALLRFIARGVNNNPSSVFGLINGIGHFDTQLTNEIKILIKSYNRARSIIITNDRLDSEIRKQNRPLNQDKTAFISLIKSSINPSNGLDANSIFDIMLKVFCINTCLEKIITPSCSVDPAVSSAAIIDPHSWLNVGKEVFFAHPALPLSVGNNISTGNAYDRAYFPSSSISVLNATSALAIEDIFNNSIKQIRVHLENATDKNLGNGMILNSQLFKVLVDDQVVSTDTMNRIAIEVKLNFAKHHLHEHMQFLAAVFNLHMSLNDPSQIIPTVYEFIKNYDNKLYLAVIQDLLSNCILRVDSIDNQLENAAVSIWMILEQLQFLLKVAKNRTEYSTEVSFILKLAANILLKLDGMRDNSNFNLAKFNAYQDAFSKDMQENLGKYRNKRTLYRALVYFLKLKSSVGLDDADLESLIFTNAALTELPVSAGQVLFEPWIDQSVATDLMVKHSVQINSFLEKIYKDVASSKYKDMLIFMASLKSIDIKDSSKLTHVDLYNSVYKMTDEDAKHININIIEGKLSARSNSYTTIPSYIASSDMFKRIFGTIILHGWLNSSAKTFKFEHEKITYRIDFGGPKLEFFRYFKSNTSKLPYKMLERSQTKGLEKNIPLTLLDNNYIVWAGNESWFISSKPGGKNLIVLTPQYTALVDEAQELDRYLLKAQDKSAPFMQSLLRFEDSDFIEIWCHDEIYSANSRLQIMLPRYGLDFYKDSSSDLLIWIQDKRYYLNIQNVNIFNGQLSNYLLLLPVPEHSYLSPIALLPAKYFMYSIQDEKMKLDVRNAAGTLDFLKKHKKSTAQFDEANLMLLFNSSQSTNSKFGRVYLNEKLQPSEQNQCEVFLQLSYMYAAHNDIELAFQYFEKSKLLFKGTPAELAWLKAMFDLHYHYVALSEAEEKIYRDSIIFSAELVALKLQVATLLTQYDQGLNKLEDINTIDFVPQTRLKNLMRRYCMTFDNIPARYRLSINEEIVVQHAMGNYQKNKRLGFLKSIFATNKHTADSKILRCKVDIEIHREISVIPKDKILFEKVQDYANRIQYAVPPALNALRSLAKEKNSSKTMSELFTSIDFIETLQGLWLLLESVIEDSSSLDDETRAKFINSMQAKMIHFDSYYQIVGVNQNFRNQVSDSSLIFIFGCIIAILQNPNHSLIIEAVDALKPIKASNQTINNSDFKKLVGHLLKIHEMFAVNIAQINKVAYSLGAVLPNYDDGVMRCKNLPPFLVHEDAILQSNLQQTLTLDLKQRIASTEYVPLSSTKNVILDELSDDISFGKSINQELALIDQHNIQVLSTLDLIELKQHVHNVYSYYQAKAELLTKELLRAANTSPIIKSQNAQIMISGRTKSTLTIQDLIFVFLQSDFNKYLELTLLTDEVEINALHQMIFDYLCYATMMQQYKKTFALVCNIEACTSEEYKVQLLLDLAAALTTRRSYNLEKHPELLVFEYVENKILFAEQVKYYLSLTNKHNGRFKNALCQIIMGGGKSKVLLPLLAWLKADGERLAVHVVTKDLFDTNYKDLAQISNTVFGQKVFPFQYSRHDVRGDDYFEKLYYGLLNAIRNKSYVLCTAESIQSLELTHLSMIYQDIITTKNTSNFEFLEKILNLFKAKADATIDEGDEVLSFNSELNYPMGDKFDINHVYPFVVADMVDFYGFMENKFGIINKYLKEAELLDEDAYAIFARDVVTKLFEDKTSLIYKILYDYILTPVDEESLTYYLLSKSVAAPDFVIENFNELQKERIAHLRNNLTGLLHFTLTKHVNEHYGLREDSKWIAVPYDGANTPSLRSEFASFPEKLNYTIQTHLFESLDVKIFNKILDIFKYKYGIFCKNKDSFAAAIRDLETECETVLGQEVKLIDLNESNSEFKASLFAKVKDYLPAKLYALKHVILGNIMLHPYTLNSNAHSFSRLFFGAQAFSGTMSGYRALEPRFILEKELSRGIDGISLDLIRNNTLGVVSVNNSAELPAILRSLNIQDFNAFIDQGAVLKNFSNQTVAFCLATIVNVAKIKYVLYFNRNQLEAVSTVNKKQIIKLNSTDANYLEQTLKVEPEAYFCFYDQKHTVGIDIKNGRFAKALLTFNEHTTLRDLQQAALRMRNLFKGQKLIIVSPNKLSQSYDDVSKVLDFVIKNQINKLEQEHYKSAILQIDAILTEYVRNIIIQSQVFKDKYKLFMQCGSFIFTYHNQSIFSSNGQQYTKVNAFEDLQKHAKTRVLELRKALSDIKFSIKQNEFTAVQDEIDAVLEKIKPVCTHEVYSGNSNSQQGAQQVNEQETEVEIIVSCDNDLEAGRLIEFLNRRHCYIVHTDYPTIDRLFSKNGYESDYEEEDDDLDSEQRAAIFFQQTEDAYKRSKAFFSIKHVLDSTGEDIGKYFNKNIYFTQNFIRKNHKPINNYMLNKYDIKYIALIHNLSDDSINYCVIHEKDYILLLDGWKKDPVEGYQVAIINLQGAVYYKDKTIEEEFFAQPRHALVLEQLCYFTCVLDNVFSKPQWILEHTNEKISFLRKYILKTHAHNPKAVDYFCEKINMGNSIRPEMLSSFQLSKIASATNLKAMAKKRAKKRVKDSDSEEEEKPKPKRKRKTKAAAASHAANVTAEARVIPPPPPPLMPSAAAAIKPETKSIKRKKLMSS